MKMKLDGPDYGLRAVFSPYPDSYAVFWLRMSYIKTKDNNRTRGYALHPN
ncbi:hypothetical protein HIMB100_00014220 [SAR116 cluster alpha proteobacterium HIMB100]|nr:hypothetical protein HIMB100_00014220 [SAR116 cluster alpha proteobacterium HIMB100]